MITVHFYLTTPERLHKGGVLLYAVRKLDVLPRIGEVMQVHINDDDPDAPSTGWMTGRVLEVRHFITGWNTQIAIYCAPEMMQQPPTA